MFYSMNNVQCWGTLQRNEQKHGEKREWANKHWQKYWQRSQWKCHMGTASNSPNAHNESWSCRPLNTFSLYIYSSSGSLWDQVFNAVQTTLAPNRNTQGQDETSATQRKGRRQAMYNSRWGSWQSQRTHSYQTWMKQDWVEMLCALTCFGSTANGSRLDEHHKHNKWRKTE